MSKNREHISVSIETKTIIRILSLTVATMFALNFLHNVSRPLILILISAFLALALNPAVSWIAHKIKDKSRVRATGAAYVLVITFLVAFFSFVFPPLIKQTVDFIQEVPSTIQKIKTDNSAASRFVYRYNLDDQIDHFTSDFGSRFKDLGKPALSTAGKVGTGVVSTVTVLVLTFMMLVEGPVWIERYFTTLKPERRKHHKKLAKRMYKVVVSYVNGQVIIAAMGGFFATIALFIMSQIFNVTINAVALGGIVALFALLPLIGTTIGSLIVVVACLFVSVPLAIAFAVYFVIYQQIENVTIQPYIQSRGNNLTPLIVFVAALLGVGLGGVLGAFLAIPTAGCIKVLVDDHFEGRLPSSIKDIKEA